jgi:hypothetical protein
MELKKAKALHVKLWDFLAQPKNAFCLKGDFFPPGMKDFPSNECYACEYAGISEEGWDDFSKCEHCPVQWPEGTLKKYTCSDGACTHRKNPFTRWCDARTRKTRIKYAKIIRDLPWKRR